MVNMGRRPMLTINFYLAMQNPWQSLVWLCIINTQVLFSTWKNRRN